MKIHISKLDAGRRQLETAIRLFFYDNEPISIYALTRSAHEVLEDICAKQNIKSVITQGIEQLIKKDKQKLVIDRINAVKNFIKHADRDPEGIVEFDPQVTQYFIWDACRLYKLLTTNYSLDMVVFTTWITVKEPEFFIKPDEAKPFFDFQSIVSPENKIDFYCRLSTLYNDFFGDVFSKNK